MFNLFDLGAELTEPLVKQAQWRYIRDGLRRNVDKVLEYYRTNPTAVAGDHFLVRLLQSISVPKSLDIERYYDNVTVVAPHLSSVMGMTSAIYKGTLFNGIFYGRNSREVLISQTNFFDLRKVPENWMNLTPIRVVTCPITSLGLDIPDGRGFISSELPLLDTVSVFTIDIPMLATMYREFRRNEWQVQIDRGWEDSERSLMMFLRMYVLPNMLATQIDQVIFNRAYALRFGLPRDNMKNRHPFYLTDFSAKLDQMLMELNGWLEAAPRTFQGLLKSYPAVFKENLYQSMELPDYPPTRQIIWAMLYSRLKVFYFLIMTMSQSARDKNGTVLNRLFREIRMIRNARIMEQVLPLNYQEAVDEVINAIAASIGYRQP
jgi:hypothetical protein